MTSFTKLEEIDALETKRIKLQLRQTISIGRVKSKR